MPADRATRLARSLSRVVFALTGAAFGALAVALSECREAVAAAALDAEAHPPPFASLVLADLGVLAPLALAVGAAVAAASLFLEPGVPLAPTERLARLRAEPVLARSRTAALALLSPVAACAWLVVAAQTGRRLLADGAAPAAGMALAVSTLAWLLALGGVTLALLPGVRRALAASATRWPGTLDPAVTATLGGVLAVGAVVFGALSGDTGGEGAGPLAIFGVLKRTELDLRPVVDLAVIAACAWVAPLALRGRPARPVPLLVALAMVVGPLAVTGREARALEGEPTVARAVERRAPLGRIGLALARRVTDRDHDGTSPLFGGGDCNDRDPRVSPLATDVPGNGVDEDCSGADLPAPAAPATPAASGSAAGTAPAAAAAPRLAAMERDLNLLFITIDTVRASEMGFLGCPRPTSPNLDALAAQSVVFDDVYSMASYTGKALAPMLIGKYPSETLRDGGHFNTYAPGNVFLAERLRAAGLLTMGAASHWYFKANSGVTQGIDFMDLSAMPASGQGDTDSTVTGDKLTDAAIKLLQAHADGHRFMLWIHYFDPHAQYVPHAGEPDFNEPGKSHPFAKARAAYDGEIWFTDQQIGRLLDFARTQPWWKDTVVVVTSDHGEALGEHGINAQHGWEIWEPLMRIPLVVYVPGVTPHHVKVKRSAIDIVPTVLDLLRVPPPGPGEVSGQSLLADLALGPGESPIERDVYLDMPDGPYTHMRRGLLHGPTPGTKLIHLGGRQYQLYDLATDPDEKDDQASDAAKLRPMVEAMQQKRATLHEVTVKVDAP